MNLTISGAAFFSGFRRFAADIWGFEKMRTAKSSSGIIGKIYSLKNLFFENFLG